MPAAARGQRVAVLSLTVTTTCLLEGRKILNDPGTQPQTGDDDEPRARNAMADPLKIINSFIDEEPPAKPPRQTRKPRRLAPGEQLPLCAGPTLALCCNSDTWRKLYKNNQDHQMQIGSAILVLRGRDIPEDMLDVMIDGLKDHPQFQSIFQACLDGDIGSTCRCPSPLSVYP